MPRLVLTGKLIAGPALTLWDLKQEELKGPPAPWRMSERRSAPTVISAPAFSDVPRAYLEARL